MRAMFLTTETVDCANHVRAWNSLGFQAEHVIFHYKSINNDWQLIEKAREYQPDAMFYIGAHNGSGIPGIKTLCKLHEIAPLIHLCSDAADAPWHSGLTAYHNRGCFDLQVAIDGASDTPVDLSVLTPIDPKPFMITPRKDIRCGFSGGTATGCRRGDVIQALEWFSNLTVRKRTAKGDYKGHARFMRRCRMVLNDSRTGTGHSNHIKGRVVEAGFANCALLESEGSPIGKWFPKDCYILWRDAQDAARLIKELDNETINRMAKRLAEEVHKRYTARHIYGEILGRIGLHVGST